MIGVYVRCVVRPFHIQRQQPCQNLLIAQIVRPAVGVEEGSIDGNGDDLLRAVRKVGVDVQLLRVAGNEQWRILQRFTVLKQLLVGGGQALARPLVFDGKVPLVPDIGPAVATAQLGRAGFEGEELVLRVERGGRWVVDPGAEVEKMLLVDLSFGGCIAAPLGDKFLR